MAGFRICRYVAVPLQRARRHDRAREERKTIGALFIDVFEAEARKIGGAQFLVQGTLHPDVIETVSLTAAGREGYTRFDRVRRGPAAFRSRPNAALPRLQAGRP
jgi:hypothetical protein